MEEFLDNSSKSNVQLIQPFIETFKRQNPKFELTTHLKKNLSNFFSHNLRQFVHDFRQSQVQVSTCEKKTYTQL